tara:strand:- start:19754 stop:20494 length:741 start_codon:yes stop_codon:yes gene_type:complete
MSIWGKLIGGAAGFAIGGPLGMLLGVAAGHLADNVSKRAFRGKSESLERENHQQIFAVSLIALSAKMAKADGRVTSDEIKAFKAIFRVPSKEIPMVANIFDKAKEDTSGFEEYAFQVSRFFKTRPEVLEELLGALMHIAAADGVIHPKERSFLSAVADIFGFDQIVYERIAIQHGLGEKDNPYKILGVKEDDSNQEIKKVYRELVRENHPDHLIAQGVPEELINLANEKLAAINDAYAKIEKERGL